MAQAIHAKEIEALCGEQEEQSPNNNDNRANNNENGLSNRFKLWLIGFAVSCIPIVSPPILFYLFNEKVLGYWQKTLSGAEITFIGITLCITAMYDLISKGNDKKKFPWTYLFLLIAGGFFFAGISVASELSSNFNYGFAIVLNFSFLGIALLRGIIQYIVEYKERF